MQTQLDPASRTHARTWTHGAHTHTHACTHTCTHKHMQEGMLTGKVLAESFITLAHCQQQGLMKGCLPTKFGPKILIF